MYFYYVRFTHTIYMFCACTDEIRCICKYQKIWITLYKHLYMTTPCSYQYQPLSRLSLPTCSSFCADLLLVLGKEQQTYTVTVQGSDTQVKVHSLILQNTFPASPSSITLLCNLLENLTLVCSYIFEEKILFQNAIKFIRSNHQILHPIGIYTCKCHCHM